MDISECRNLCPSCMKNAGEEKGICPHCKSSLASENPPHCMAEGSSLNGKYYVGKTVGETSRSITYLGLDLTKNQRVIIKEFYPGENALRQADKYTVAFNDKTVNADVFYKEKSDFVTRTRNLAFFRRYKGVVAMLDDFDENGTSYRVLEYTQGVLLSEIFQKRGTFFPPDELLMLLESVFIAVNAFNEEHVVHGKINPDNIIVTQDGAMLLDCAENIFPKEDELRNSGYFAPEQVADVGGTDSWTDIYSLTAVYYKGVAGVTPPPAVKRIEWDRLVMPTSLNKGLSVKLESAILKGLSVDAKQRYKRASQLYDDLVDAVLNQR